MIMVIVSGSVVRLISQLDVLMASVVAANSMVVEARVCVRKYFVEASVDRGWCDFAIIGIMDRVLISKQVQIISQ